MNSRKIQLSHLSIALTALLMQCSKPVAPDQSFSSRTILAIFAHPDDEATVSPVLAQYAAKGVTVYLAVATDGRLGVTSHAQIPAGDSLASVRREELKCAAEKLGIKPPIMFGLEDQLKLSEGYRAYSEQIRTMREKVKELLLTLEPDVLITWGASGWTGHPDHRMVGTVVTEVFQSQAWKKTKQLYYPAIPTGNLPAGSQIQLATVDSLFLTVKVPVSELYYEKAKDSWLCHKSQYTPERIEEMHQLNKTSLKGVSYFQPLVNPAKEKKSLF